MAATLDVDRFFQRLGKLHQHFVKHNSKVWYNADCLIINRGPLEDGDDSDPFAFKSAVLHQWLFGYELPDTIMVLTKDGHFGLCGTKKKCAFVEPAVRQIPPKSNIQKLELLKRNKTDGDADNYKMLWTMLGLDENKKVAAVFVKERDYNLQQQQPASNNSTGLLVAWEQKLSAAVDHGSIELVDMAPGVSFCMSIKDEYEQDLMKKSSVFSNKVMKHGFVKRMEQVIDQEEDITHAALAQQVQAVIDDPTKIALKVPAEDVASAYMPTVQSHGTYDIKLLAPPSEDRFAADIIIASIGTRYRSYASSMARTFLVDPPKKVSNTYEILVELQDVCLEVMKPGRQLKEVYKAVVSYLEDKGQADLVTHLPKNLGKAMGLDLRDGNFLLTAKNSATFKPGMVFSLALSFADLELTDADRESTPDKSQVKKLSKYSLLLSDMVAVTSTTADILTKMGRNLTDIAYNINDEADEDDDESDGGDDDDDDEASAPDAPDGDEEMAKKLQKERGSTRASSRLAKTEAAVQDASEGAAERERKQINLMVRRNEERVRELAKANRKKGENGENDEAEELESYKRTRDYPDGVQPNQVKVDMANQCVILPVCGNPIPFHISTVKNVVMPDADGATLLRINFYTAGMAVGKEAPANMVKLVQKYAPYASFIREMTFRSLDSHNLTTAFRQISELRKRARQKELQQQEEATLVEQEKLVRTKNERVPRLADLTMRPSFSGRKTQGNLEAHTNGLRFISNRSEVVDIMYNNIKYAIYQPCERDIMVLIHFHLKNPIMIGKKKQKDVQFFTEVVESSQAVNDARRSMYDPDEMDDEQRERQLRKRLNSAFKEFCKKVDAVAKKNDYPIEFDIPYSDLAFTGNPHKEMVAIMPTLNCLVNLTETPFFVVDLDEVDHVHFERVTYMSKAFDVVLINKDFNKPVWRIDMIPHNDKDAIQEWLTDMEISYTEGPMNLNWKSIINTVKEDDRFYMDTEEDDVTKKEAGWEFLRMYGHDDDDEGEDPDGDDSEFDEEKVESEPSDEESEVDEFVDDSDEDEDDFEADEDLDEQGLDWEEMEREAAAEDKRKRRRDEEEMHDERPAKRSSKSNGKSRRR